MKHKIITFLVISFAIIFCITLFMGSNDLTQTSTGPSAKNLPIDKPQINTPGTAQPDTPGYTLAQVQSHASSSDCWSIVGNTVYDLTSFISQHPGGSGAILSICGKDGTAAFEDQHGGQRRPANELQGFEIGIYKR
jgi:hypothetical protein